MPGDDIPVDQVYRNRFKKGDIVQAGGQPSNGDLFLVERVEGHSPDTDLIFIAGGMRFKANEFSLYVPPKLAKGSRIKFIKKAANLLGTQPYEVIAVGKIGSSHTVSVYFQGRVIEVSEDYVDKTWPKYRRNLPEWW